MLWCCTHVHKTNELTVVCMCWLQKFRFCGGLEPPDWLLAELPLLTTLVRKALQVVNDLATMVVHVCTWLYRRVATTSRCSVKRLRTISLCR